MPLLQFDPEATRMQANPGPQKPMPLLNFDPEATLEEIAGIGRHEKFDALIDDKDNDAIQVICKRGTENIPLANPARAFYFGDRVLYKQEADRYSLEEKQVALNTDTFSRSEPRFDELKRACQRGFVVPFVGAGMSKSAGCPEWKEYLLNLCPEAGFDTDTMRQRLEDLGDYEGLMHDLVTKLGENRFARTGSSPSTSRRSSPPTSTAARSPATPAGWRCPRSRRTISTSTSLATSARR